jgi:tetratricopeptide (TPR) repeat protein
VQGAIEQATNEYGQAVAGAPNDARIHYRYTYGLIMEGDYDRALIAAENAVTANPFSADAWAIRALALEKNERYPEAIASALQALSISPNNANALAFMSETYLDADQPAQAEEKANQAVNANPDSAEAHFARGRFYAESAFLDDEALADYGEAHDLAPNLPQVLVELAWINWRADNYDVGLDQLEQVVEKNPNHLDALFALGYFQYQVYGDPNKAEDYLTRCVQADARNIDCLNYLATVQIGLGNPADAAQTYQRIIDAGTTQAIFYLRAGRTYATLNDCGKATPLLRLGYAMERSAAAPDADRLSAFEEYMSQCGAPIAAPNNALPSGTSTPGAPLLIPLDGE